MFALGEVSESLPEILEFKETVALFAKFICFNVPEAQVLGYH